jgi:hypothetical protein
MLSFAMQGAAAVALMAYVRLSWSMPPAWKLTDAEEIRADWNDTAALALI